MLVMSVFGLGSVVFAENKICVIEEGVISVQNVGGKPGAYYKIEQASALGDWMLVSTPMADEDGLVSWNLYLDKDAPSQFFRITEATEPGVVISTVPSFIPPKVAVGGGTNVPLLMAKFHASVVVAEISQVALNLGVGNPTDLTSVSVWDGDVEVGRGQFAEKSTVLTLSQPVSIEPDSDKLLMVRGDFSPVTIKSGQNIVVSLTATNSTGVETLAASGGEKVPVSGDVVAVGGVRVFKSTPTFTKLDVSTTLQDGPVVLMRLKLKADESGDVGLKNFGLNTESSVEGLLSGLEVQLFSDEECSTLLPQQPEFRSVPQGAFLGGPVKLNSVLVVPAGKCIFVEIRGVVTGSVDGSWVSTRLIGENSPKSGSNLPIFAWTPFTTTSVADKADYFNSFGLSGVPSEQTLSR